MPVSQKKNNLIAGPFGQCEIAGVAKTPIIFMSVDNLIECRFHRSILFARSFIFSVETRDRFDQTRLTLRGFDQMRALLFKCRSIKESDCGSADRKRDDHHDKNQAQKLTLNA